MTAPLKRRGGQRRTETQLGRATWRLISAVLAEGVLVTEKEIARRLGIGEKTVGRYLRDYGQQVPTNDGAVLTAQAASDDDPMATKRLLVPMPDDLFARLEKLAASADRDPSQQARALIRQALDDDGPAPLIDKETA